MQFPLKRFVRARSEEQPRQEEIKKEVIDLTEEDEGEEVASFYRQMVIPDADNAKWQRPTEVDASFYCTSCKEHVPEEQKREHMHSFNHFFNSQHQAPPPFLIPQNNRGYQMMLGLNWDEQGLGSNNQGRLLPIKTQFREGRDRSGLGAPNPPPYRVTHAFKPPEAIKKKRKTRGAARRERREKIQRDKQKDQSIRRALYS